MASPETDLSSASLVSIVTPAYNAARFIGETIRSVQAQTHGNWEMNIVDDCSSDDTRSIVEQFSGEDARVRLIRQPRNAGPSFARDTSIQAGRGRFVAFLDSDDLWLPTKLERQIRFMREKHAAVSFTRFQRFPETGGALGHPIRIPDRLNYRQLLLNTAMGTSTVLIDREATGAFRMPDSPCDDYALWLELLDRGFDAYGLQEVLTHYRVVSSSFSRNKAKYAKKVWRTYRQMGLHVPHAAWCFGNYAARAWLKYRRF